ncbi:MAG: Ribonuclease 3 [Pseudomonadota bacterium]|jgi:ribonuclease-3
MEDLQKKIGYSFKNKALLKQALTHRSYSANHSERLEFLGDAVLDLLISTWLYKDYENLSEGELSRIRSNVVCKEVLARIGQDMDLSSFVYLGAGELKSGGATKDSILADCVEAILGAIYLDNGLDTAMLIVKNWFQKYIIENSKTKQKDSKSKLQEYLQGRKMLTPKYVLQKIDGNAHEQIFTVECIIEDLKLAKTAKASTKKEAEQLAALAIMKELKI